MVDDSKNLEFIAAGPWFQDVPQEGLERLAQAATLKSLPVNHRLYSLGEPTTEIYGLVSGRVRISVSSPQGQEFATVDHEPGAWLGEPGLASDAPRILDGKVIEKADVLVIPRATVLAVAEDYPIIYRNLFKHVQNTLREFHELLRFILFYPLKSRVAGRLLLLATDHGKQVDDGMLLDIRVSQNDFAHLALGSRQRVNKVFRDWAARGLVELRDDHILIRDVEGLEAEVQPFD